MSDLFNHILLGAAVTFTPANFLFCFLGALFGTIVGVLPGLGPIVAISLLLPITFTLEPASAIIMLAGIFYGAQYGGSTTSILLNIPGEASSVATCLDGHAMARKGRAGAALGIAAIGSLFAGCVATVVVGLFAPALSRFAISVGPADNFSMMLFGLVGAVGLARGSLFKALAMVVTGVLLGLVGVDLNSSVSRFDFGIPELSDGLNFVVLAMGLFGLTEVVVALERRQSGTIAQYSKVLPTAADIRQSAGAIMRGTAIGSILGILPGGGIALSSFTSYILEKKIAKDPTRFGEGAIEGVAGPESANNASSQTSFIPLLTLGIPSNAVMALMAGALMIHGITPGPTVISSHPDLFWGLVVSMWIGNAILIVLNLPLIGLWVRLLKIRYDVLFPMILLISCVGIYSASNSTMDIIFAAFIGLFGFILIKLDFEPAPLLLGFVLGPMLEENLRRALIISRGDLAIFVSEPLSLALLVSTAILLVVTSLPHLRSAKSTVFQE